MTTESTTEIATPSTEARVSPVGFSSSVAAERRRYLEPALLAALIVIMLAQLWTSVVQLSVTSDEVDHLHAAYRYWQCNDFGWNPEHPPLVKIVAGLPLQFMHINDPIPNACGAQNEKGVDFRAGHRFVAANPERILTSARFAVSIFPVLLLVATWFFARKMFGVPVALIAAILVAFEPNILGHGALITTDVAATLGFLLAVYALYGYAIQPNFSRLIALGLAVGFAFCAKYSTITLVFILPTLLLADALLFHPTSRVRWVLRQCGALLVVAVITLTVLWACYGFRYSARPGGAPIWNPPRPVMARGAITTKIIPQLKNWHAMPEAYLVGVQDVLVESEIGRASFLLGKQYRNSNWFYFPVAAAIKFTVPLLVMSLISAIAITFWSRRKRELLFILLPPLVFFAFSMRSGLNIGIRHVLPVVPLFTIFAAAGMWSIARSRRWAMALLIGLLVFQAVTSLRAYPNYICYANELWGGPSETYRYLSHADVDWGQAQKMVRDYVAKTHPSSCFFIRAYNSINSDNDIPCEGISEIQWDQLQTPYPGILIAGSSAVNGVGIRSVSAEILRALKNAKPIAKLGGSAVLVYQGPVEVGPIVAVQLVFKARQEGDAGPELALSDASRAAQLDPLSGDAHVVMCGAYHTLGELQKAQEECSVGLAIVRKDPQYGPEQVKYLEDFITRNGLTVQSGN